MPKTEVLFIDLDETIYPKSNGLWQAISKRINSYLTDRMGIPLEKAMILRQQYFENYGTTLRGLMENHAIDPIDYLDYVHDVPIERMIQKDPQLRILFEELSPRCYIFTNASVNYAKRILQHLNIEDRIEDIIDILALQFHNKPRKEAYDRALAIAGNPKSEKCMLVDDRIPNLSPAKDLGMTTVLVGDMVDDPSVDYALQSIHEILTIVPGIA
jgi:putative hydrolase of the HAD superfamily